MRKFILEQALVHHTDWAIARVLNHFKITPTWFHKPTVQPEELIKWCQILIAKKHPRQKLTSEDRTKIVQELKRIIESHTFELHEDEWRSTVHRRAAIDDYECYKDAQEREVVKCPSCNQLEDAEMPEYMFEEKGPNYLKCNNCSHLFRPKVEEAGDHAPEYWYQDRSDMQVEDMQQILQEYCDHLYQDFDGFLVEGRNLNWRGSSGHAEVEIDADRLLDILTVNSDYTLNVEWMTDDTMQATCAHHDATSYYEVIPAKACCETGKLIHPDDLDKAKELAEIFLELGGDDYDYIHPETWEEEILYWRLSDLTSDLSEEVVSIVEELGLSMTVTIAKNLRLINEAANNE